MDKINSEPVASAAALLVLVNAVLVCLVSLGVTLSADQTATIMAAANAVVGVVSAVWARSKVSPVEGP